MFIVHSSVSDFGWILDFISVNQGLFFQSVLRDGDDGLLFQLRRFGTDACSTAASPTAATMLCYQCCHDGFATATTDATASPATN